MFQSEFLALPLQQIYANIYFHLLDKIALFKAKSTIAVNDYISPQTSANLPRISYA